MDMLDYALSAKAEVETSTAPRHLPREIVGDVTCLAMAPATPRDDAGRDVVPAQVLEHHRAREDARCRG